MRLIVGLGNPGEKFIHTRHNIGFMILGKIADDKKIKFLMKKKFQSEIAKLNLDGKMQLAKPQTFMNNSGDAVAMIKKFYQIDNKNIWLIHDDVDLPLRTVRINLSGSSAGHKGIASIISSIGENFWRIRVGIGKNEKIPTEDWVLMNFEKSEQKQLENIIDKVSQLVLEFLSNEIKEQTFNY